MLTWCFNPAESQLTGHDLADPEAFVAAITQSIKDIEEESPDGCSPCLPVRFMAQCGGKEWNVIPAEAGIHLLMSHKQPAVYILASKRNGTLYIGVTSDLRRRVWEHTHHFIEGFTKRYGVHHLVYYELHEGIASAIQREKQMKQWNRAWKLELIEKHNPDWRDLWEEIL